MPRVAGSILGSNGLGYTFSVMVSTLKRIFVVSYPPLLGWLSSNGESLYSVIFISYFSGVCALVFVVFFRLSLIRFFVRVIYDYSRGRSFISIFFDGPRSQFRKDLPKVSGTRIFDVNLMLIISSSWVFFIYGSSLFFINLFGSMNQDKSAVIYQLVGLVNALGTLFMSFFLDPKLSKNFDNKDNVFSTYNSVVIGQFLALGVVGPFSIFVFYMVFS